MIRFQPKTLPIDYPTSDEPRSRQCLKCRSKFNSEWSGERVCTTCKRKSEWRSGVLPRSF